MSAPRLIFARRSHNAAEIARLMLEIGDHDCDDVGSAEEAWHSFQLAPAPLLIVDTALIGASELRDRIRAHPSVRALGWSPGARPVRASTATCRR